MTACAFRIEVLGPPSRFYSCRADQTLLDGALQCGVFLPYGCGAGRCSMCRTRVIDGSFQRLAAPVHTRAVARDLVFACCTRPLSDLVLSYE